MVSDRLTTTIGQRTVSSLPYVVLQLSDQLLHLGLEPVTGGLSTLKLGLGLLIPCRGSHELPHRGPGVLGLGLNRHRFP